MKRYGLGLLTLALLAMPLWGQPMNIPTTAADLSMFPPKEVAFREMQEALRRQEILQKRSYQGTDEERTYYRKQTLKAFDVWSAWDDLYRTWLDYGSGQNVLPTTEYTRLNDLRTMIGAMNYYHGQMPAHVPLPEKEGDK